MPNNIGYSNIGSVGELIVMIKTIKGTRTPIRANIEAMIYTFLFFNAFFMLKE